MGTPEEWGSSGDPQIDSLRKVVPGRAVLTELARGFLLVNESDPTRAKLFAETFLRECSAPTAEERVEVGRPVPRAQRQLGRLPRGAVDPSNFPPTR
jgi:hypothetical protein